MKERTKNLEWQGVCCCFLLIIINYHKSNPKKTETRPKQLGIISELSFTLLRGKSIDYEKKALVTNINV